MVLQHGAGDASIDTLLKASSFLHAAEAFEREARRLAELGKD
jgi:hypothetical protein